MKIIKNILFGVFAFFFWLIVLVGLGVITKFLYNIFMIGWYLL